MSVRQQNLLADAARRAVTLSSVIIALACGGAAFAAPTGEAYTAGAASPARAAALRTVRVTTVVDLAKAVALARPGDRIALADGVYAFNSDVALTSGGTADNPVVVAAENVGQAIITGIGGFGVKASYLTIEGFVFNNAKDLLVPAIQHHVRVTRNTFQLAPSVKNWVTISGDDCEVDHNTFTSKSTIGVFLMIAGPGESGMARNARVHHNYFKDHTFAGANGGETIRVGLSTRQHGSAAAVIEDNVLDNADGDPEAISIKSSDNIVRHNTLLGGRGTITLRHGSRNIVDGNVLIGGSTGIRVFGDDQSIVNNVVQDSTRAQLIEVGGGEIRTDVDSTDAHEAADRVLVSFNTLVNGPKCTAVLLGGKYPVAPDTITITNNVLGGVRADALTQATRLVWQGNVAAAATSAGAAANTGAAASTGADQQAVKPGAMYRAPGTTTATGPGSA